MFQVFYKKMGRIGPGVDIEKLFSSSLGGAIKEAQESGLTFEDYLKNSINESPLATLHNSRRSFYNGRPFSQRICGTEARTL